MSITWFSPLDAQASEIARYSAELMPYLENEIDIAAVDDGAGSELPGWWHSRGSDNTAEPGMNPLPVYHIGNNPLHLPIYQRSLEEPGLVVLHDLSLVDLARHLSREREQPDLWKELMCRQYGEEVRALVNRSEKSVADYNEMVTRFPLFQPFLQGAMGVVVHSHYAWDAVHQLTGNERPLLQLNLPASPTAPGRKGERKPGPLRFIFCGHVGPNRRLLEFMEAWGQLGSPQAIHLDLFGNVSNSRQLLQYASHFGVGDYVTLRGYVSDVELEQALQSADFAINLRWPTMGEASASQLRYWSAALPTLVTDVGWYSELPQDAVCRIPLASEGKDLLALLEAAIAEPTHFEAVGIRGREQLRSAHQPEQYAQQLASLATRLSQRRLAYRMLDAELVNIVAAMCEHETDTRLFRSAIETAVATCSAQE